MKTLVQQDLIEPGSLEFSSLPGKKKGWVLAILRRLPAPKCGHPARGLFHATDQRWTEYSDRKPLFQHPGFGGWILADTFGNISEGKISFQYPIRVMAMESDSGQPQRCFYYIPTIDGKGTAKTVLADSAVIC